MSSFGSVTILRPGSKTWPTDCGANKAWIFSNNVENHATIEQHLPDRASLAPVGDAINEIAQRLSSEFINIDEKLTSQRFYKSWLASTLGERNPYRSDFFLSICQAIAIIEAAQLGDPQVIMTVDQEFGDVLAKTCHDNKIEVYWYNPANRKSKIKELKRAKALLSGLKYSINQIRSGKKWRQNRQVSVEAIYLLSWAGSDSFPNDTPKNQDANFGSLPQWIRELGKIPHWIMNPLSWINPLPSIIANTSMAYDVVFPLPGTHHL